MIVCFDYSALAEQCLQEQRSEATGELFDLAKAVATSILSRVEVSAALAKAARMRWKSQENAKEALRRFPRQWTDWPVVEAVKAVVSRADLFLKPSFSFFCII